MKVKHIILILMAVLLSVLLSGFSGAAMRSNSWAGLTADESTAYLANGSFVYAVNLGNGSEAWRYPAEDADSKLAFFAAPALTTDGQLIIGSAGSNHSLISLDPKNGSENWRFSSAEDRWIASPLVTEDAIYAPNADGTLYVLSLDGSLLWTMSIGGTLWGQPVSDGDLVYLTSLDHHLYAIDPQNHDAPVWDVALKGAIPGAATLGPDGILYLGSFGAELEAVNSSTRKIVWNTVTDGWIWDAPALDGETLYFGDLNRYFYSIDARDGSLNWDPIQPDGPIVGSPLVMPEAIAIATESGSVYAIDRDGRIVWKQTIGGKLYGNPVLAGDLILVSPMEAGFVLAALDTDGKQVWTFTPAK